MSHRYADLDTLLADLLPEVVSTQQKAAVGRVLDAASAFIDKYTQRPDAFFMPAGVTPTVRRFRGEGRRYLRLPEYVPGSLVVDGILDSTYYAHEKNGWLYFTQAESLELAHSELDNAALGNLWYTGRLYTVTARWGYAATPALITEAARQLTLKWWETQRGTLGDITPSGYVVERAMPVSVRESLDLYTPREFERAIRR